MKKEETPIKTTPDGVWEGSKPAKEKKDIKTDWQGNGYPENISVANVSAENKKVKE